MWGEAGPLAILSSKKMIRPARDHIVAEGLNHAAAWNAGMLSEAEIREAIQSQMENRAPQFED